MELSALTEGQVFASRYNVVRCIAAGGMGAVYEVTHTETDRRCALKVMLPHIVANEALRERFKREARITAPIGSEFIVDVLDAGVDEATEAPFLVMEYLDGNDLSVELDRDGKLQPEDVVTYLWQTSMALNKTHAANIVHRDLKPENIFLTRRDDGSPRVKILDFGISKVIEASTKGNSTMTLGTPLYMAPEQFKGSVSPPTDIYALGMIAYTLLVGVPYWQPAPGEEESVFALATRIMEGLPETASVRAARHGFTFPDGFDAWFSKVTARDGKQRYPSALDAIKELGRVYGIELKTTSSVSQSLRPPPPSAEPARAATGMTSSKDASGSQPTPQRSRMGLILGATGAVAVAGVAIIIAMRMGSTPPTTGVADSAHTTVPAPSSGLVSTATASATGAADAAVPSASASAAPPPAASTASAAPTAPPPPATKNKKGGKSSDGKTSATTTPENPVPPTNTGSTPYSRY
ncbi:MAG: serine/threonine protein kinase [Deltaproteobacteria bacterium]|nr:serine/threonine protein kinase [Deltaproteobacteria bacterium]